ncbi:MAG: YhbY family RNA-binding protein [Opitutales bacterium]
MSTEPDSPPNLSSAEKKHLRGLAQTLEPAVSVGRGGLTSAVIGELDTALTRDCLVKVKLPGDRSERAELTREIETQTGATCVGAIGAKASFYRPRPVDEDPIDEASAAASGASASKKTSKSRK